MIFYRWLILSLFVLSNIYNIYSQPIGSGGVSDLSTHRFWYASDELSLPNGTGVATWSNSGGNGTDALQNNAGEQPLFFNNVINGLGILQFDGFDDFLDIASNNDLDNGGPYDERTFHIALRTSGDITSRQVIYQEGGGTRGLNIYIFNGELYYAAWNFANDGAGSPWGFEFISTPITTNTEYYISFILDGDNSSTGIIEGYINGSLFGTMNNIGFLYNHNNATIGSKESGTVYESGNSGGSGEYFEGEIAEFIIYNYAHNEAERIIIENYLSAKFNITPSANDFYTMDNPGNGDYDFDMAGIGQFSATEFNDDAQGRNDFRILNPVGLNDGEYMMWGHDGASSDYASNNSDIPSGAGVNSRMDRVWRVSELGNIGSYDLNFDANCNSNSPSNVYLLIDSDNDGIFSDETIGSGVFPLNNLGGGIYGLNGINQLNDGVRFTFGFDGQVPASYANVPGPGGIGDNSVNRFWFDANDIAQANGTTVQNWINKGGNADDYFQNTASDRPTFQTNQLNGFPLLSFDGTNDHFDMNDNNDLNSGGPWSSRSFTILFNTGGDINSRQVIYEEGGGIRGLNIYIVNGQLYAGAWNINNDSPNTPWGFNFVNTPIASNTNYIVTYTYDGNNCKNGKVQFFVNGSFIGETRNIGLLYNHTGDIALGAQQNDSYYENGASTGDGNFFEGSIAEFIMYNYKINTSQRIIIENYISGKYALNLSSSDIYTMDNPANGDYDNEIAGIGRENGFEEDNDSQGPGMVRVNNASSLDNNDYFIWGHDNGNISAFGVTDIPSGEGVQGRLDRIWRPSEQGETGNMDFIFDLSLVGGNKNAGDLVLLIDRNNDGQFADETFAGNGIIGGATALGGDVFEFSGVNISNAQRFTIGTMDNSNTPLPIELLSFDVRPIDNQKVSVDWTTASETNNDYFLVERSIDGVNFKSIKKVEGAGNSSQKIQYNTIDNSPYDGLNYYRLKQVDNNGEYSYSQIKSAEIENQFNVYPSPVQNGENITVNGLNPDKDYTLEIRDVSGRKLFDRHLKDKKAIEIQMNYQSGTYFLNVYNVQSSNSYRIVVQ